MVQNSDNDSGAAGSEHGFWLALISGLVGACSAINLIVKAFHIGLAPLLGEFIGYYRKVAYYFVDLLAFWWPFHLAESYKDCVVLAFVLSAPLTRALFHNSLEDVTSIAAWRKDPKELMFWSLAAVISQLVLGFSLLGILAPLFVYWSFGAVLGDIAVGVEVAFRYVLAMTTMIVASIVFFVLNSQF